MTKHQITLNLSGNGGDDLTETFDSVRNLKDFLYFLVETQPRVSISMNTFIGNKVVHSIEGQLNWDFADILLIWAYYFNKFPDFRIHNLDSPQMISCKDYVEQVIRDSHTAYNQIYLPTETADYALVVVNRKLYLALDCSDNAVKNKIYRRLSTNLQKHSSYSMKDEKDILLFDKKHESVFIVNSILSTFSGIMHFLRLNERRLRELMKGDNIYLRTSFVDKGVFTNGTNERATQKIKAETLIKDNP